MAIAGISYIAVAVAWLVSAAWYMSSRRIWTGCDAAHDI